MLRRILNAPLRQARINNAIMSVEKITTISPITNKPILTRNGLSDADIQAIPETATRAFESFRRTSLAERQQIVKKALKLLDERQDALGKELTEQMGRPIAYTPKEVTTAVMRGEYLLKISDETLKDTPGEVQALCQEGPFGPCADPVPMERTSIVPSLRATADDTNSTLTSRSSIL
jgi:acyl-CoA reductase-like NAD-dependent aldehyde dehydrogenase